MHKDNCITQIAPDVLRIRANNPSPLTGTGTNSYLLINHNKAVLIDPGPDLPDHIRVVLRALQGAELQGILISHAHLDHSAAARNIAAHTNAHIYSHGAPDRRIGHGQEGVDLSHCPNVTLQDGQGLHLAGMAISVHHTPGHMQGHLCFGLRDQLFSGDHVMGWATSAVTPPEGDMASYRASLGKLRALGYARYLPGHGEIIDNPAARLDYLIEHRNQREAQVLSALSQGAASAQVIAAQIYTDTPAALLGAAAQNVLAHLIELAAQGQAFSNATQNESPTHKTIFARR